MRRYVLTDADREKGIRLRRDKSHVGRMRREAEMCLLDTLYAEMAMPEWYPER